MKTNPLPGLIGLGCASALTRAGGGVEKMELIPLYFYDDASTTQIVGLGSAVEQTRADGPGHNRELNPI